MDQFVEGVSPILTEAILAVALIVIKLIADSVIKLLNKGVDELKERRIIDQNVTVTNLAAKSVKAVEKIANVEHGTEKFEMAKDRFISLLNNAGITLTEEQIETFIEASVFEISEAAKNAEKLQGTILLEETEIKE